MKPEASKGPARPGIHRQFETNRLAKDFQARAYEETLPIVRRLGTRTTVPVLVEVAWAATELVQQKGVAA